MRSNTDTRLSSQEEEEDVEQRGGNTIMRNLQTNNSSSPTMSSNSSTTTDAILYQRRLYYEHWQRASTFVWIYVGSHLASVAGCRLLSYWLDQQWDFKLQQGRTGWWKWAYPVSDFLVSVQWLPQIAQKYARQHTDGEWPKKRIVGTARASRWLADRLGKPEPSAAS